jgi:hypothetical protein
MFIQAILRRPWLRSLTDVGIGALLTLSGVFLYHSSEEDFHFNRLVHSALTLPEDHDNAAPHTEGNVVLILHKVNSVMNGRFRQVADVGHLKPGILWSSDEHLSEPSGACASYTQVLGKALQTAGYPIRKIGLSKNGQQGIHHVLETFVEGHWVLMDALTDMAFQRPDGHLAGAAEVHANWEYYRKQTAPDYNQDWNYSEFYYTNWNRVPVLGSLMNAFPSMHRWLEERGVSVRFWVLDVNQWFTTVCAVAAGLLMLARFWPKLRVWRSRRRSRPNLSASGIHSAANAEGEQVPFTGAPTA